MPKLDKPTGIRPEILLCPQIPKPLHGLAPRVILGKAWWDFTRQEAYRVAEYKCLACGVPKHLAKEFQWLEGHELYATDYCLGRMEYLETVAICHYCHNFIHKGRLLALVNKKKELAKKFIEVMQHGVGILKAAGLASPKPYEGETARWKDWRLVLNGKKYSPLYGDEHEWSKAYAQD